MFGALLNGATLCVFDIASEGLAAFSTSIDKEQITVLHPPVLLFRRFLSLYRVRICSSRSGSWLGWRQGASERCRRMGTAFFCVLRVTHRFSTTETGLLLWPG